MTNDQVLAAISGGVIFREIHDGLLEVLRRVDVTSHEQISGLIADGLVARGHGDSYTLTDSGRQRLAGARK